MSAVGDVEIIGRVDGDGVGSASAGRDGGLGVAAVRIEGFFIEGRGANVCDEDVAGGVGGGTGGKAETVIDLGFHGVGDVGSLRGRGLDREECEQSDKKMCGAAQESAGGGGRISREHQNFSLIASNDRWQIRS